jgi:hypothetical protein
MSNLDNAPLDDPYEILPGFAAKRSPVPTRVALDRVEYLLVNELWTTEADREALRKEHMRLLDLLATITPEEDE